MGSVAVRSFSQAPARSRTRPPARTALQTPSGLARQEDTLLAMQRSIGNQAVCRLIATARPIQRFVENDPLLAPGKVSETGQLAVVGAQEAYGTATAIADANQALAQTPARVRIESGAPLAKPNAGAWNTRFGANPTLNRMQPVFSATALGADAARTQPVVGDTGLQKQTKLKAYQDSLGAKVLDIVSMRNELEARWKKLDAKWLATEYTSQIIWNEFNGRITGLVQRTMGPMWATTAAALAVYAPQGAQRNALTLATHLALFDALGTDYYRRFTTELEPEINLRELWMTLPNDCKNAAMTLTGKNETELNQRTDNPAIGANYGMALGSVGHVPTYGWATHYATVIAKDASAANTDNVTFETAANINAGMTEGKSLGFFEMYGTANPVQTFSYITLRKNRDNIIRQATVDLAQAKTATARQNVISARDEDLAKLDLQLALRTPLPVGDDEDL